MGWCAIIAIKPILAHLPMGGILLTAAGGLAYSGGVVFYAWERLRYHHAIWHLFVLTGSVLQYFAIRSEEHTSELQSLMRISYAVFCLKKKTHRIHTTATLGRTTRRNTSTTHT